MILGLKGFIGNEEVTYVASFFHLGNLYPILLTFTIRQIVVQLNVVVNVAVNPVAAGT